MIVEELAQPEIVNKVEFKFLGIALPDIHTVENARNTVCTTDATRHGQHGLTDTSLHLAGTS